jgi:hypothetical protein
MHTRFSRILPSVAIAGVALSLSLLASCGRDTNPSPTNAALNTPEGTAEKAPARPEELKPPAIPPQPGHLGRNP